MSEKLGIIGAGRMAEAIVKCLLNNRVSKPGDIIAADIDADRRDLFARCGISVTSNNPEAARADIVFLSVKPQHIAAVLEEIAPAVGAESLIISIAAGIATEFIERRLGPGRGHRVVRAMPNTPMLVGKGVVAISRGRNARPADMDTARRLFAGGAAVLEVPEAQMDAVTALSGSGPAYFFFLVEQMIRAGTELGLDEQTAAALARDTAEGAAAMLKAMPRSPEDLRNMVTSPGGTTEAAIRVMKERKADEAIVAAISAAADRARELAAEYAGGPGRPPSTH